MNGIKKIEVSLNNVYICVHINHERVICLENFPENGHFGEI